ncbi:MAG: hypothetical protein NVSMB46_04250 [Candidatus Saccharimonadales bacterium]
MSEAIIYQELYDEKPFIGLLEELSQIADARQLVADRYLNEGYITGDDLDNNGFINTSLDPYVDNSTYFGSYSDEGVIKATLREIKTDDPKDLPVIKSFNLENNLLLQGKDPSTIVEISAVAKVNGGGLIEQSQKIVELYAAALRYSIESGQTTWVMGTDHRLTRRLGMLFGRDTFEKLGESQEYMGSVTDPIMLDLHKASQTIVNGSLQPEIEKLFKEHLQGINPDNVDKKILPILQEGGLIRETVDVKEVKSNRRLKPETLAKVGLFAYCAARAIPVGMLSKYGVNNYVFFGLDVITIPPYVNGTSKMLRAKNARDSFIGGATAISAFSAPYLYVGIAGSEMSIEPALASVAYLGLFGALAVRNYRKKSRSRQDTEQ